MSLHLYTKMSVNVYLNELNVNEEIKVMKRKETYLNEREGNFICLQNLLKNFIMF